MNVAIHSPSASPKSTHHINGPIRRPNVNITPVERIGRVVIGVAAITAGAALLTSAGAVLAVVLEVLLIGAGLDLAITGTLGHCPLYAKLGHVPTSLRRLP